MENKRLAFIQSKIADVPTALHRVMAWRLKQDKVVFTNGCFDILHQGHVTYLAQAAGLGNRLIIGLNTDTSVKRQGKGEERPVNPEHARAMVLAALGFVDLVVLFDGDTPLDLISTLKPDVLVKGADYDPEQKDASARDYIVGSDIVRAYGGQVAAIPLVEGFSTTSILGKLKS